MYMTQSNLLKSEVSIGITCCSITGTASVTVAGLIAATRLTGTSLKDGKYLFQGAGEVRECDVVTYLCRKLLVKKHFVFS